MTYSDRYPGNEPGPDDIRFADPDQYPPERSFGAGQPVIPCVFQDGEIGSHRILGWSPTRGTCSLRVCEGHAAAVIARDASWFPETREPATV